MFYKRNQLQCWVMSFWPKASFWPFLVLTLGQILTSIYFWIHQDEIYTIAFIVSKKKVFLFCIFLPFHWSSWKNEIFSPWIVRLKTHIFWIALTRPNKKTFLFLILLHTRAVSNIVRYIIRYIKALQQNFACF